MTTIQVEGELKSELFSIAAELQEKLGRRVTLNEAIRFLIESHRHGGRSVSMILPLFGCVGPPAKARNLLKGLRMEEKEHLEGAEGKHDARH